jgi:hypothetical protein
VKKYAVIFLILFFSTVFLFSPKAQVTGAAAKSESRTVLVSVQQTNATSRNGDLVLSGNDFMVIKDAQFTLNGSLLMSSNSTLVLDNTVLIIAQPANWVHRCTMRNSSHLILKNNARFTNVPLFDFYIYDNSLINVTDSTVEERMWLWNNARVQAFNSKIDMAMYSGGLLMVNSTGTASGTGKIEIVNSNLTDLGVASSDARIVDSRIDSLSVSGGSLPSDGYFGPYVSCHLVNSTYGSLDKSNFYNGSLYVEWYLAVAVESEGQPVEGANIQVYHAHDGSLVAQQTTPSNGTVQFILPETQITPLGNTYLGEYTVKTSYREAERQENITLNTSKQMTITLLGTEFPVLPVLLALLSAVIALLLVLLLRKRATKAKPLIFDSQSVPKTATHISIQG